MTKWQNSTPPARHNPPIPTGTSASLSPTATLYRFRFANSLATREWRATSKVLSLLRPSLPPDGIFLFSYRARVRLPKRIHRSLRQPIQTHARSENMPVQHRPQQQRHTQFLIQNSRKNPTIHSPAQQHSQAGARAVHHSRFPRAAKLLISRRIRNEVRHKFFDDRCFFS